MRDEQPRPRIFVDKSRCVLVEVWPAGTAEVATRPNEAHIWGQT